MEGLLSSAIKTSLEKIVSHCFYCNRIADRICSILSVKFVMPITSNIIHENVAHLYPLLADNISGYMDSRDCTIIYGETPKGNQEYDSAIECFNKLLEVQLQLENLTKESIAMANKENDYTTKVLLDSFLLRLIPLTSDLLTLVDKAELYSDSSMGMMKLDHDVPSFNLFGGAE